MQSEVLTFTEYEEEILFDVDDPDFAHSGVNGTISPLNCSYQARGTNIRAEVTSSSMSLAGVRTPASEALLSRSHSFDTLDHVYTHNAPVITIEDLRLQLNSCFTCGVSWHADHVSLDCTECGGYSLQRPCPRCNGQCDSIWRRDITMSHSCGKARWTGECALQRPPQPRLLLTSLPTDLPVSPST